MALSKELQGDRDEILRKYKIWLELTDFTLGVIGEDDFNNLICTSTRLNFCLPLMVELYKRKYANNE